MANLITGRAQKSRTTRRSLVRHRSQRIVKLQSDTAALLQSQRFSALDGWRGICACIVVLFHFTSEGGLLRQNSAIIRNGFLFVDFFFVLSGFVLTHRYRDAISDIGDLGTFIWRRFARLWPLHMSVILFLVALELARAATRSLVPSSNTPMFGGAFPLSTLPLQVLFGEGFGLSDRLTWNQPSWSIAAEFWGSVAMAVLFLLARPKVSLVPSMVFAGLGMLLIVSHAPLYMNTTFQFGFVRCCIGFALGMVAYEIVERAVRLRAQQSDLFKSRRWATLMEVSIIALACAFVAGSGEVASSVLAPLVFSLVVICFAMEQGAISGALKQRVPQALARWSYSIYMLQMPVFFIALYVGGVASRFRPAGAAPLPAVAMDALALLLLLMTIGIAAFTFRFIEMPAQKVLDNRIKPA